MVTRHEFLAQVHNILRPRRYLETGVQYGTSLKLAIHSELAIGVDPAPLVNASGNQRIFHNTSDDFFLYHMAPEERIDFAFIDGSHMFEDALKDFINVELHSTKTTVVVFDDVLPYTQQMASRIIQPGHWTGDVWRIFPTLTLYRPDLTMHLVNTEPTGTLIVWNLNNRSDLLSSCYGQIIDDESQGTGVLGDAIVPNYILQREHAVTAETALYELRTWFTFNNTPAEAVTNG